MALLGREIDEKYRVISRAGQGGTGGYEVLHIATGAVLAMKTLDAGRGADRAAVRRLEREARLAGSLGHPSICRAYDFGHLPDGVVYLILERLTGETLAARIARERWIGVVDCVCIFTQVLMALEAVHAKGICHRALSSRDIFIVAPFGGPPRVKVLDIGSSSIRAARRSDARDDERADLHAAGAALYEALTGRNPTQIAGEPPDAPSWVRPELSAAMDALVRRALGRRPHERYSNAAEFLHALRQPDILQTSTRSGRPEIGRGSWRRKLPLS